jgi:hypothetical protein
MHHTRTIDEAIAELAAAHPTAATGVGEQTATA